MCSAHLESIDKLWNFIDFFFYNLTSHDCYDGRKIGSFVDIFVCWSRLLI